MSKFDSVITDVADTQRDNAEKIISGNVGCRWLSVDGGIDGLDHDGISDKFNRDAEGKQYQDALDNPVAIRTLQAAKLKSDVLASLERDVRSRYRGRVRMMAHAAAKLESHGLEEGPVHAIKLYINRLEEQAGG